MDAIAEIVEPLGLEFIGAPAQGRRKYRGSVEVEGSTRVIELECDDDGRNASAWRLDVGGDADEAGDETDVATAAPAARGGRTALRIEEILVGLKWSPIHGHIRWRRMPIAPSSCDEPVDQTAALLALEVNDAAVVGLENDLTVVVEGVPDDEGRFYKVEHRSTHDGKHAMVLCLETPFEASAKRAEAASRRLVASTSREKGCRWRRQLPREK